MKSAPLAVLLEDEARVGIGYGMTTGIIRRILKLIPINL